MRLQSKKLKYYAIIVILFISQYIFAQNIVKDSIKTNILNEIILVAKNPISEKFSVTKVEKLDIYFNPVSNGDPLKAITILPSSTNIEETANPTLRGGSADRSRVYINGSPILNPVRNGQDNGLGNFSLLNTEIIDKQYVYASNPPLTYGNSSAGIVEIETNKNLKINNIQISTALSNIGFLVNKDLSKDVFFQLYANNQFSDAFIKLNKKGLPYLNKFESQDIGLNSRLNINKNLSFNTFNYYINESYNSNNFFLNFSDNSTAHQKRFFSINNFDFIKGKSKIRLSTLLDNSHKEYMFGIIDSDSKSNTYFTTLSHKYRIFNNLTIQYGYDFYSAKYKYNEQRPLFYYSVNDQSPSYINDEKVNFNYSEIFFYADYKINNNFGFSSSLRKNIFITNNLDSFISYQASSFYNLNSENRFIFGFGHYNSYTTPNYFNHNISLLNSKQIALDYYLEKKKYSFISAIYYKNDKGDINTNSINQFDKIETLGVELSINHNLNKYLSLGFSNTFLSQNGFNNNTKFKTSNNLKYFIKTQILYNNPKILASSISLNTRPGSNFTRVENSILDSQTNNYQPIFGTVNNSNFNNYFKLDFTVNKVFNINDNVLIAFCSINNLLNNKNQSSIFYNNDYSNITYNYYQSRIIYFGFQYRLNKLFNKNL